MTRPNSRKRHVPKNVPGLYVWQSSGFDTPHIAFTSFEGFIPSAATDQLFSDGIRGGRNLRFAAAGPAYRWTPWTTLIEGKRTMASVAACRALCMDVAAFEQDTAPFQLVFHGSTA